MKFRNDSDLIDFIFAHKDQPRVVLLHGFNDGLASFIVRRLSQKWCIKAQYLYYDNITEATLLQHLSGRSLFDEERLAVIKDVSPNISSVMQAAVKAAHINVWTFFIGNNISSKSSTKLFFESINNSIVFGCYWDNAAHSFVKDYFHQHSVSIGDETISEIAACMPLNDRMEMISELDKLLLAHKAGLRIGADIIVSSVHPKLEEIYLYLVEGDYRYLEYLPKCIEHISEIGLIRVMQSYTTKLLIAKESEQQPDAINAIFTRSRIDCRKLITMSANRIAYLIKILLNSEIMIKTTSRCGMSVLKLMFYHFKFES